MHVYGRPELYEAKGEFRLRALSLERFGIGEAESELRSHVQALAADAEAERTVINARLNELRRRIEELVAEAESRLAPTFRTS